MRLSKEGNWKFVPARQGLTCTNGRTAQLGHSQIQMRTPALKCEDYLGVHCNILQLWHP